MSLEPEIKKRKLDEIKEITLTEENCDDIIGNEFSDPRIKYHVIIRAPMVIEEILNKLNSSGIKEKIVGLDFFNHDRGTIPEILLSFTSLRELNLSETQLTELPDWFGSLAALEKLELDNNELTELPDWFGQLTALKELYLGGNRLTKLPNTFGQLTALQELELNNNELTELPDEFRQLTALRILYLDDNQLTELPAWFGRLTALQELHLNNNQLTKLPDGFGQLTALQTLGLYSNQLTQLPLSARHWTNPHLINHQEIAPLIQQLLAEISHFADIMQGLFLAYGDHQRRLNLAIAHSENDEDDKQEIWRGIRNKMEHSKTNFFSHFFNNPLWFKIIEYTLIKDVPANGMKIQLTASPHQFGVFFKELRNEMVDKNHSPCEVKPEPDFVAKVLSYQTIQVACSQVDQDLNKIPPNPMPPGFNGG